METRLNGTFPGFRDVPRTGVIYVTSEASLQGYSPRDRRWANLGQGSPETGDLPGAPPRIDTVNISAECQQYAPVAGSLPLRQAVADYYNTVYRAHHRSKYSADNVSIASGGRLALARVASALDNINLGHFIPDYTAYEELLGVFKAFNPIPILLDASASYRITADVLKTEIVGRGLRALLLSNPSNPTGQLLAGDDLKDWCALAREYQCSLIFDEFYSHYVYPNPPGAIAQPVSAAAFVEDVDEDPVVLVDGLTKNWRYPGWRVSWTLAPRQVIEAIGSAGSFLDGGANHPLQSAAAQLLRPEHASQETRAIQTHFREKRDKVLARLNQMGIIVEAEPAAGFYVWANLSGLPEALRTGDQFFRELLKEKVVVVPGRFFDVNPGNRRTRGRYENYCRISFGPEWETLDRGLVGMERVISRVAQPSSTV